jgi:lactoylglutathione lyase
MNMKIEHIAIWTNNIETLRSFYQTYFGMTSNDRYVNPVKDFISYFLSFGEGKTRIELMSNPDISNITGQRSVLRGFAHLAISVGNEAKVNELTERLRSGNFVIVGEPRITGDGYYESVVLDPDGNRIEITV